MGPALVLLYVGLGLHWTAIGLAYRNRARARRNARAERVPPYAWPKPDQREKLAVFGTPAGKVLEVSSIATSFVAIILMARHIFG